MFLYISEIYIIYKTEYFDACTVICFHSLLGVIIAVDSEYVLIVIDFIVSSIPRVLLYS